MALAGAAVFVLAAGFFGRRRLRSGLVNDR
jgi:hypothetical protein